MRIDLLVFILVVMMGGKTSLAEKQHPPETAELENMEREIFQLKNIVSNSEKSLSAKSYEYQKTYDSLKSHEEQLEVLDITLFNHHERIKKQYRELKNRWSVLLLQQADQSRQAEYTLMRNSVFEQMKEKQKQLKSMMTYAALLQQKLALVRTNYEEVKIKADVLLSLIQKMEQEKLNVIGKIQEKKTSIDSLEIKKINQKLESQLANGNFLVTQKYLPPLQTWMKMENSQNGINFLYNSETSVLSPAAGKVVYVGELANYGNVIMIEHSQHMMSVILGEMNVDATKDSILTAGAVIAKAIGDKRESCNSTLIN